MNHPNHIETATRTFHKATSIRAFLPHMHFRGKSIKYELFRKSEVIQTFLEVPRHDFNWQLRYGLKNPIKVNPVDKIKVTGNFDNSMLNLANPIPNEVVYWGDQSDDEMLIGYLECEFDLNQFEKKNSSKYRDFLPDLIKTKTDFS